MLALANQVIELIGPPDPKMPGNLEMLAYFATAAAITALCVLWVLRRSGVLGMDTPDGRRKLHEQPTSRIGGAPIFVSLLLGLAVMMVTQRMAWWNWMPVLLCNALIFSVGLIDDLKPLGARVKLGGQIVAALALFAMGLSIDVLSNPFGEGWVALGWWSLPLTLLWLVSIPNIINLIDGMDGLAGGFGLFLALTLAFVGYISNQADVVLASLVMAGALGGFLFFNFPPAKIFLGDGGAYLIGFFVASVSLKSSNKGSIIAALLVIIIALGIPILDTAFAILRRAVRGVPIFSADAEHFHHRLILLGYSKQRALAAMYAVCLVLSLVGISILLTKGLALPVAGAILFLLAIGTARYLGYVRSWTNLRQQIAQTMERRRRLEHVRAHARVLEFDMEKCETLAEFTELLLIRFQWIGFRTAATDGTVPVLLTLARGATCILYRPSDGDSPEDWNRRTDAFVTVFERCLEKWQSLPVFVATGELACEIRGEPVQ
jgi:UDP-GlcNAc:undecaprenyl-phosphate GlcNAc-1-phosphate transferase